MPTGPFTHRGELAEIEILSLYGSFVELDDTWNDHPASAGTVLGKFAIQDGKVGGSVGLVPCGQAKVQALLQANLAGPDFDFTWFGEWIT